MSEGRGGEEVEGWGGRGGEDLLGRCIHSGNTVDTKNRMHARSDDFFLILLPRVGGTQSNHLRARLSSKTLFVANMCGKIAHANNKHIHTPNAKAYVAKEFNNFGVTASVFTKVCNFHTGIQNSTTLMRAGTNSKEIESVISHVFVLEKIVEVVVHNIVFSARLGRPISSRNTGIGRAIEQACGCSVLTCLQIEESMFVHSFHVQVLQATCLPVMQMLETPLMNVRINICRTGVVFFVGVPGGMPLRLEPEKTIMGLWGYFLAPHP